MTEHVKKDLPVANSEFVVEAKDAKRPLEGVLRGHLLGASWGAIRELIKRGKVSVDGVRVTDGLSRAKTGARVEVRPNARRIEQGMLDDKAIAYLDPHLVVVHKPAGISTVPFDENERLAGGTLDERVRQWLIKHARQPAHASLGIVHRIDKETSGLVVFARTFTAKKKLAYDFRLHTIERRYVAIVHGVLLGPRTYRTYIVEDRGDGIRGSAKDQRIGERIGQLAVTHVAPIAKLSADIAGDGASLVACALETGRTHQLRIHLSEAAMPIAGDRVYTRDRLRREQPMLQAPRMMLHAIVLGFTHPITGKPMRFFAPIPDDLRAIAARLGGGPIEVDPERLPL